jgi:PAS domain S-box-containing protein
MKEGNLRVLIGWKEVASYLNCSISTAGRRAADGLPVFRVGGSVRAFADDIDRWLEGERLRKLEERSSGSLDSPGIVVNEEDLLDTVTAIGREKKGHRYAIIPLGVDTSDYEHIERRLASAEEKYRWLLETVPVWIWETDAGGEYNYSNVAIADMLGYRPEDLAGFRPDDFLLAPEEAEKCSRAMGSLRREKKIVRDLRCRYVHRDGTERWLETDAEPIFDGAGDFAGIRGVSRDVTERKRAEEKEKEHLRILSFLSATAMDFVEYPLDKDLFPYIAEKLAELAGDAVVTVCSYDGASGRFQLKAVEGLGDKAAEVSQLWGGDPLGSTFPMSPKVKEYLLGGKLHKTSANISELTGGSISKRAGREIQIRLGLGSVYVMGITRYGELLGAVGIITGPGGKLANADAVEAFVNQASVAAQRKKAEEALVRAAEEWRRTFDAVPDMILFVGRDGKVVRANRAAAQRVGGKWENVVGRSCCRVVHGREESAPGCPLSDIFAAGEERRFKAVYAEGLGGYFDFNFAPVEGNGLAGAGAVMVGRDVTDKLRAEQARERERKAFRIIAEAAVKARGVRAMCERVVAGLGEALGFELGTVRLYDEDAGTLVRAASYGMGRDEIDAYLPIQRLDDKKYIAAHVARERRPIFAPDLGEDGIAKTHKARIKKLGLASLIAWPIIGTGGALLGVMQLGSRTPRDIPAEDRVLFEAVGGMFGTVLERRRAEERLRKSEAKHRLLLESIGSPVLALDPDMTILYCNGAYAEFVGRPGNELEGRKLLELFPEFAASPSFAAYAQALEAGTPQEAEGRYGEAYLRTNVFPMPWGILAVASDITDRRRAEEALRESEEKFRNLAEESPNMIFINKGGKVVYANKKCEDALGYGREEFYAPDFDFLTVVSPTHRRAVERNFASHVKGADIPPLEYALETKSGDTIEAILTAKLISYEGSSAILGIVTDISERKRTEEALRASEARFRAATESLPFDFFVLDENGRCVISNSACRENWGDVTGKCVDEVGADAETVALWLDNNRRAFAGEVVRGEVSFRVRGEERHYHNVISPVRDGDDVRGILGVNIDITERKRAEDRIRDEMREKEAILSSMVEHIVCHDADMRVLWANAAAAAAAGAEPGELVGRPCYEVWHGRDGVCPGCPVAKTLATGERHEAEMTTPEGKICFVRGYPVKDAAGNVKYAFEVALDVTKRRRAEEALRDSEERYRGLFEKSPLSITLVDPSGVVVDLNRATEELIGYAKEEVVGKRFEELPALEAGDVPRMRENFAKLLRGEEVEPYEFVMTSKRGGKRRIEVVNCPWTRDGETVGIQVITMDAGGRRGRP